MPQWRTVKLSRCGETSRNNQKGDWFMVTTHCTKEIHRYFWFDGWDVLKPEYSHGDQPQTTLRLVYTEAPSVPQRSDPVKDTNWNGKRYHFTSCVSPRRKARQLLLHSTIHSQSRSGLIWSYRSSSYCPPTIPPPRILAGNFSLEVLTISEGRTLEEIGSLKGGDWYCKTGRMTHLTSGICNGHSNSSDRQRFTKDGTK